MSGRCLSLFVSNSRTLRGPQLRVKIVTICFCSLLFHCVVTWHFSSPQPLLMGMLAPTQSSNMSQISQHLHSISVLYFLSFLMLSLISILLFCFKVSFITVQFWDQSRLAKHNHVSLHQKSPCHCSVLIYFLRENRTVASVLCLSQYQKILMKQNVVVV